MGNEFFFPWEFDILYWFQDLHNPILDKMMIFITTLGNAGAIWIILTAIMFFFCKDKRIPWTSLAALLISVLLINLILKNTVSRARPSWIDTSVALLVKNPKDYSFPSGHSSASFATAISVFQYKAYRKQGLAAIVLAILIALSRIYLFVHFPTDVVIGVVLGIVEAIVAGMIVKMIFKKKYGEVD